MPCRDPSHVRHVVRSIQDVGLSGLQKVEVAGIIRYIGAHLLWAVTNNRSRLNRLYSVLLLSVAFSFSQGWEHGRDDIPLCLVLRLHQSQTDDSASF